MASPLGNKYLNIGLELDVDHVPTVKRVLIAFYLGPEESVVRSALTLLALRKPDIQIRHRSCRGCFDAPMHGLMRIQNKERGLAKGTLHVVLYQN